MKEGTGPEMGQRVAALRRFRELLVQQRTKFENYLKVLDHERTDIESGDVDRLAAHVEIEEGSSPRYSPSRKSSIPSSRYTARPIPRRGRTPSFRRSAAPSRSSGARCFAETRKTEPSSSGRWSWSEPR